MKPSNNMEQLYKKYVKDKKLYRVVSEEYIPTIKKEGLTPNKNPFKRVKKKIYKFFKIVKILENQGDVIDTKWGTESAPGSRVAHVTIKDLKKDYIDLNPDKKHNAYYKKMNSGALVWNLEYLADELLKRKDKLTKKEIKLIKELKNFCKEKKKFKMKIISINADSEFLEKAHFQHFTGKYWKCPLGSFENFKKIIEKYGWDKYRDYLEGKKLYYLRTKHNIPATEINFEK